MCVICTSSNLALFSSTGFQPDRPSVTWLEEYLIAHINVTCLIVSHDSRSVSKQCLRLSHLTCLLRFLDSVTTDIIHCEEKKVCAYLMPPRRHNLWGGVACVLQRKPFKIHGDTPRSQIVLYLGCDLGQVLFPNPRLFDGCPEQYSCHSQNE
jgi:hypothetical protein